MRKTRRLAVLVSVVGGIILTGAGCSYLNPTSKVRGYREQPQTEQRAETPTPPPQSQPKSNLPPANYRGSNTAEGHDLSDQLMLAAEGLLADARVIDNRQLYVKLGAKATQDMLPELVRALLLIMHERFPKNDISVHVRDRHDRPLVKASLDVSSETITYTFP